MSRDERFEFNTMKKVERVEAYREADTNPYARSFSIDDYHGIREAVNESQSSMNF